MRASPALAELMVELQQLGKQDRRAVLERLGPSERQRIESHLAKLKARAEPSFDALSCLSPWLAESLAEARSGAGDRLTPAAREALADAEQLLPRNKPAPAPGLSLFDRIIRKAPRP